MALSTGWLGHTQRTMDERVEHMSVQYTSHGQSAHHCNHPTFTTMDRPEFIRRFEAYFHGLYTYYLVMQASASDISPSVRRPLPDLDFSVYLVTQAIRAARMMAVAFTNKRELTGLQCSH